MEPHQKPEDFQLVDCNKITIILKEFVISFVHSFEKKLESYIKEVALEGFRNKSKLTRIVVNPFTTGFGSGVDHRQKATRVSEIFRSEENYYLRDILVTAAGDIFWCFQNQFIRVNGDGGSSAILMEKLARDAMDRAIYYIDEKEKLKNKNHKKTKKNLEVVSTDNTATLIDLITKGVIFGKSKTSSIICFWKHGFEVKNLKVKWNTSDLYGKIKIKNLEKNNEGICLCCRYSSLVESYGYRLPFRWESCNLEETESLMMFKNNSTKEEVQLQLRQILDQINKKDSKLIQERLEKIGNLEQNINKVHANRNNRNNKFDNIDEKTDKASKAYLRRSDVLENLHKITQLETKETEKTVNGNWEILKILQDNGTNPIHKSGRTILHYAAEYGQLHIVEYLLNGNIIDINCSDKYNRTPLHIAASCGNLDMLKYLLLNNADRYAVSKNGNTVLHYAVENAQMEIIEYLLNSNIIDIDSVNNYHETPLHKAVAAGRLEIVKLLLLNDADSKAKNIDGWTALHFAVYKCQIQIVQYLLSSQIIDIDNPDTLATTPLHIAVASGNFEIVKLLLENGANPKYVNIKGSTISHFAIQKGQIEIMKYLLSNKIIDINIADRSGMTPLHVSVFYGQLEMAILLLNQGAHSNVQNIDGWSVLHFAVDGQMEITKYLLKNKLVDVNVSDIYGMTPLHVAAIYGYLEFVILLLEYAADSKAQNMNGWTALHFAAQKGELKIVKYLVFNNISDTKISNNNGNTPLDVAYENNKKQVVEFLLETIVVSFREVESYVAYDFKPIKCFKKFLFRF